MATTYENFDLLIDSGPSGFRARVLRSLAGDATTPFELPFDNDELTAFFEQTLGLELVEENGAGVAQAMGVQEFGSRLYQAVFAGAVGTCLLRSLDEARRRQVGLRIRLRLAHDLTTLNDLPWEYLYAPTLRRYLALSDQTPLVRYLETEQGVQPLPVQPPLTVLAVLASPCDWAQLSVDKEWSRLQSALANLQQAGLIRLERLPAATLDALQARLRLTPVHVLHFVGHGYFGEEQGGVVFETETGTSRLVSAETLGMLLHDHTSLRLVFLNACEGARSQRSDPFAGVAQRLVQQGLPAVLAMQFPVGDQAAIALSSTFYRALADGLPADTALGEARKDIAAQGDAMEWGTPVLFSRSDDNRLIELPHTGPSQEIDLQPFEPKTVSVPGGPFVMGSQPGPGVSPHETPQHSLVLPAFRIGKFPVTNEQYERFVSQTGRLVAPEMGWEGQKPPADKLAHPATGLSWYDALAYCRWLSSQTGRTYTLPTEAQWEKAARGVDGRVYPWGDAWEAGRSNAGGSDTSPVEAYQPQSVYGCHDMVGNVRQWTLALWGERLAEPDARYRYPLHPDDQNNKTISDQVRRIWRGSSYSDPAGQHRCAARGAQLPNRTGSPEKWLGFRVALMET